ncbi:MAG: threonine--tRNA ligase [Nitrososphaerales archaeon]|nr:threonine--tRNA ligase [Nitrososphaerales archaeon]
MKILQMHVDFIEYKPIKKEIAGAEEAAQKQVREEELVVLFTAVEEGDDVGLAVKAVGEAKEFLSKLGTKRLMIYPFAHISQNLASPKEALPVLLEMEAEARKAGLEVMRAPFGWTKALQVKVKGHPLAEMSRSYTRAAQPPVQKPKQKREASESELMARIRKSDFGGLPETDHRIIGERQDLFSFQEPSPGMVYWHDKGLKLRNLLIDFLRAELAKRGYVEISSPALANTTLWRVSGHSEHYRDNMFLTSLGDEELGLKPMNCPSTFLVYKSRKWSFRDLPVRYAIFDPLYRNELSGVASGLFRVKVLTQDDAHIIATEDQADKELADMLDLMKKVYGVFNLEYKVKISTRPDESMGSDEEWQRATDTLVRVVKAMGMPYETKAKEGNFYAPKIDVDIKDSLGREWQCGTFQLDLQMPKRFKLSYTGSDGKEHIPVVLHRTILGSMERFIGIMLEHYRGALPLWLSPVQAKVIPLSDEHRGYSERVLSSLTQAGVRAEGDFESGTMAAKIRNAQLLKIPYMLVIGKKEEEGGTVAVRKRTGEQTFGVKLEDFVAEVRQKTAAFG